MFFVNSMLLLFLLLLTALLVLSQSTSEDLNRNENTTLLLVQALFRHGERAPLFFYKNDPNADVEWPAGLGKLTRLGKHHHYALGKYLRFMYEEFLTSNPTEVMVNSSALDRCIRGAEVTAASLYEPEGPWKFEANLNWQPIPVFSLPSYEDKYLSTTNDCPRAKDEQLRLCNSEEMLELARNHQKMLQEVSDFTEMDVSKYFNAVLLSDTLRIEKEHNLTIPTLIEYYFDEILEYGDETFHCLYGSDLKLRLGVGPLLQAISENMKRKINGESSDLKIQLYCTQDVTIAAVLDALNFTSMPRPPNCATILFELHEVANATMAVRLLYLNSTSPPTNEEEIHTLVLDGCSEFCPFDVFLEKFQHLIPDNWEKECQLDASHLKKSVKTLIIVFSVLASSSFILLVIIYIYGKKSFEKLDSSERVSAKVVKNICSDEIIKTSC